jgi:hypothetical protein
MPTKFGLALEEFWTHASRQPSTARYKADPVGSSLSHAVSLYRELAAIAATGVHVHVVEVADD